MMARKFSSSQGRCEVWELTARSAKVAGSEHSKPQSGKRVYAFKDVSIWFGNFRRVMLNFTSKALHFGYTDMLTRMNLYARIYLDLVTLDLQA
jgi:hypothetical protein